MGRKKGSKTTSRRKSGRLTAGQHAGTASIPSTPARDKLQEKRKSLRKGPWALDEAKFRQTFGDTAYQSRTFLEGLMRFSKFEPIFATAIRLLRNAQESFWSSKKLGAKDEDMNWNARIVANAIKDRTKARALARRPRTGSSEHGELPANTQEDQSTKIASTSQKTSSSLSAPPSYSSALHPQRSSCGPQAIETNSLSGKPLTHPNLSASRRRYIAKPDNSPIALQNSLTNKVIDIEDEDRRNFAADIAELFIEESKIAVSSGIISLSHGQSADAFGLKLGLDIEYAMYTRFWTIDAKAEVYHVERATYHRLNQQYIEQGRKAIETIQADPQILYELLSGSLPTDVFSEMAIEGAESENLDDIAQELEEDGEQQASLTEERPKRDAQKRKVLGDRNDDERIGSSHNPQSTKYNRRGVSARAKQDKNRPIQGSAIDDKGKAPEPLLEKSSHNKKPSKIYLYVNPRNQVSDKQADDDHKYPRRQTRKRGKSEDSADSEQENNGREQITLSIALAKKRGDSKRIQELNKITKAYIQPHHEDVAVKYLDTCLLLPADAPLGWPHLIDLSSLSESDTTGLQVADMVVTILYNHSLETLSRFMDMSHGFTFHVKEWEGSEMQDLVIVRRGQTIQCGLVDQGNWSIKHKYSLRGTPMARWTPLCLEYQGEDLGNYETVEDVVEIMVAGEAFAFEVLQAKVWIPADGARIHVRNGPAWRS